jgi:hypothetical protein
VSGLPVSLASNSRIVNNENVSCVSTLDVAEENMSPIATTRPMTSSLPAARA